MLPAASQQGVSLLCKDHRWREPNTQLVAASERQPAVVQRHGPPRRPRVVEGHVGPNRSRVFDVLGFKIGREAYFAHNLAVKVLCVVNNEQLQRGRQVQHHRFELEENAPVIVVVVVIIL